MLAWRLLALLLALLALFAFAARVLERRGLRLRRIDVQVVAWRLGGLLLGAPVGARMLLEPPWPGSGPLLAGPIAAFCVLAGVLGGEAAVPSAARPRRELLAAAIGVTAVLAATLVVLPANGLVAGRLVVGAAAGLGWAAAAAMAARRGRWTVVTLAAAGLLAAVAVSSVALTADIGARAISAAAVLLGLAALGLAGWFGAAVAAPSRAHFQRPAA